MADVFFSYKRENKEAVQRLVGGLRGAGLSVWWDQDIAPDAPWEQTIERELDAARVVMVAWSEAATASENVKAEARRARNQGRLIQIFVEPCEPPLFFGERQGVDLSTWNGAATDQRFQTVLTAVRTILAGRRPPPGVGYTSKKARPWAAALAFVAVLSTVFGLIANAGGARNAICALQSIASTCERLGLVAASSNPAAPAAEERARLLQTIVGTWGRQDRDCSETVTYTVSQDAEGVARITVRALNFESIGQVVAADNGVVISRATTPSAHEGREQWEFRPDGDGMTVVDKNGVSTTLVRCSA